MFFLLAFSLDSVDAGIDGGMLGTSFVCVTKTLFSIDYQIIRVFFVPNKSSNSLDIKFHILSHNFDVLSLHSMHSHQTKSCLNEFSVALKGLKVSSINPISSVAF